MSTKRKTLCSGNILSSMSHAREWDIELEKVLEKFSPEMQARYRDSAIFHNVVVHLVNGISPYRVIEDLVTTHEASQEKLRELLLYGPFPQLIIAEKDTIEKIRKQEEAKRKKKV